MDKLYIEIFLPYIKDKQTINTLQKEIKQLKQQQNKDKQTINTLQKENFKYSYILMYVPFQKSYLQEVIHIF